MVLYKHIKEVFPSMSGLILYGIVMENETAPYFYPFDIRISIGVDKELKRYWLEYQDCFDFFTHAKYGEFAKPINKGKLDRLLQFDVDRCRTTIPPSLCYVVPSEALSYAYGAVFRRATGKHTLLKVRSQRALRGVSSTTLHQANTQNAIRQKNGPIWKRHKKN